MTEKLQYEPWYPVTQPYLIASLGKLQEELGELMQAVARVQIQGPFGWNAREKENNVNHLADEMGHVLAQMQLVRHLLGMGESRTLAAMEEKIYYTGPWLQFLKDNPIEKIDP